MNLKREVSGEGPIGEILFIAEAPSWEELKQKRPLIGPSGQVFRRAIAKFGLADRCRIENVIERKLQDNDIATISTEELKAWHSDLAVRIETCKPKVIVPLGDTALKAISSDWSLKISDVQSYVLRYKDIPVIPAYHPAFIFRQPEFLHWFEWAIAKASRLVSGKADIDKPLKLILNPSFHEAIAFLAKVTNVPKIGVDIECVPETTEITSIAIATPEATIAIPLAGKGLSNYWSPEEETKIWIALAAVLSSDSLKVFQNFIFDTMILRYHGLETKGELQDTLIRANCLNPLLPKSLEDLGRLYLYCEPWKKNRDFKLTGDPIAFWRYNALDAARTLQIYEAQEIELKARNLWDYYFDYQRPLLSIVYALCVRGIRVDKDELARADSAIGAILDPLEAEIRAIGDPLVPPRIKKKKLRDKANDKEGVKAYKIVEERIPQLFNPRSDDQVKQVLSVMGYRIPIKNGKETTNREALLKLNRKNPSPFIGKLLTFAKLAKLKSSYTSVKTDKDDRIRCSYNVAGTISGRFSAQKTPWDTGLNIQTIPRPDEILRTNLRSMFIPDEGMTLIEVDLSQAELRVVAWLAGEARLVQLLDSGEDVHQYTAVSIERATGISCPRQLGKRVNHAANYGMGAEKFADSCLLEADLAISVSDAARILAARSSTFPAIAAWHRSIEAQLHRTRKLVTPYGREAYFYGMVNSEMTRQALSYIPQSTVVDTLNKAWIFLSHCIDYNKTFNVLGQFHDSLLIQVSSDRVKWMLSLIDVAFDQPKLKINNVLRKIPHECKVGQRWGELRKV